MGYFRNTLKRCYRVAPLSEMLNQSNFLLLSQPVIVNIRARTMLETMTAQPTINVFVICTMTKRFLGTGNLLLREVSGASVSKRFSGWVARIQQSRSPALPVIDTYSGGHWSVVRSLNHSFVGGHISARLWIVSAGYGLISPADQIIPYGATFAPGHPDSISSASPNSSSEASVEWWRLLSKWCPPGVRIAAPRSIEDMVTQYPGIPNLLVLSPDYFKALRDDLCQSLKIISDAQKLIILSSDERSPGELAANTIRVDARLQAHVGGARSSLGVRTARAVLQELIGEPITVDSFRAAMQRLVTRHGVVQVYDRQPQSDEQVLEFLSANLSEDRTLSSSRLLDKFRSSGRACERKRFHKLFTSVKERRTASLAVLNGGRV